MMNLERKNNYWLFVGILVVCFFVSVWVRYQQFETWKKTPDVYFVGERPLMTTLDAPFWLRWAREFNEGTLGKVLLQSYPIQSYRYRTLSTPPEFTDPPPSSLESTELKYYQVQLLSFLIAHLSPFFEYNYYLSGTLLIPVLASLFIFPLGIYFFRIGVPSSGLLGGLIGTFAGAYYMRSSIGRIDTDMLNLFFPVLTAVLILFASRTKKERSVLLYSVGTGLSLFMFHWWYSRASFVLVFFVVFVFSLFVHKIRFRTILLSSLLFMLCAQPVYFMGGLGSSLGLLSRYFTIEEEVLNTVIDKRTTPASFPNTMTTISEVDHVPMEEVLQRILSNKMFAWTGFIAFFGLAVLRWRVLLPLTPMLALGLMSFYSSNRFIMYLAPFIGIGLGWLLQLGIEAAFVFWPRNPREDTKKRGNEVKRESKKMKGERGKVQGSLWDTFTSWLSMDEDKNGFAAKLKEGTELKGGNKELRYKGTKGTNVNWWNWARQVVLYLGMGVFFWWISGQTAISFVPGPSIHPRIYMTFLEVKEKVPENAALLTWWDYGYAINDATGLATFHDGGSQFGPKTYFIARSLISSDQDELYDITQFLATEGSRGIEANNTSPEALLQEVRNPKHKPWDPIYLFFTADMTGKYGAISKLGSWDIEKGGSKPRTYQNLACNKITNVELNCRGAKIDLKAGIINDQLALRRLIFIRNGQVLREQKFGHNHGFTLQLLVSGKNIVGVQLIDEEVFLSNYNQMFLLGRFRKDLYEETYNAFPFSRLYRIKY